MNFIPKSGWARIAFLAGVLLAGSVVMHVAIRSSGAYSHAADAFMQKEALATKPRIELCFACAKSVSFTTGHARYRFVILVTREGGSSKVLVTAVSRDGSPGYEFTFENLK